LAIRAQISTSEKQISLDDELLRLIRGCVARDRKAQRSLYDKYVGMLNGVTRRYVNRVEIAEEILNDAFIIIFTKIDQYAFSGSFEGWMRRITVNCITDYFRKNAKHQKVFSTSFEEMDPFVENTITSNIQFKELLTVIQSLPEMQRAVFNLYVFEEYIHKEIAEKLSISEGYSKWYLNDARKRIKEKMVSMQ
jgi:RNA polymerase sigma-70 factor (ECF subfamily)